MRDIKFRGKSIATGKWVYGGFVHVVKENLDLCAIVLDDLSIVSVKHETVGQYVGFKDRNGKEVYEGDIILHKTTHSTYRITWDEQKKRLFAGLCNERVPFRIAPGVLSKYNIVVIGNEIDSPELLKPQDNETEK